MELQVGQLSQQFELIRPLGQQKKRKFSSVFLMNEIATGKPVVLKIANHSEHGNLAVERLRQEGRFQFKHPQLPNLLYTMCNEDEVALIFTYFSGVPLNEFEVPKKYADRFQWMLSFLRQINSPLKEIHDAGIVHLDLKPSNFLISDDHSAQIIDFGMAHRLNKSWNRNTLFSLGYSAPELILNEVDCLNYKTDYFTLGVLCYWLLERRIPLTHPNPSIMTNLQLVHPLPEGQLISSSTLKVLNKMCSKVAFQRPPNQLNRQELQTALQTAIANRYDSLDEFIEELEKSFAKKNWKFW